MHIREVTKNDIPFWSASRTQLWPDTEDGYLSEINAFFNGESIDIEQVLIAETRTGEQVGFLELNIRDFAEGSRQSRVPYVEGWFIIEQWRGQGIGKRLMVAAEDWARTQGFTELASDTPVENTTSIAMHKRLGFDETERVVCFLKTIGSTLEHSQENSQESSQESS